MNECAQTEMELIAIILDASIDLRNEKRKDRARKRMFNGVSIFSDQLKERRKRFRILCHQA